MTEEIKVVVQERKRGGKRVGAGRPAQVRINNERIAQGLPPVPATKKKKVNPFSILPENKKKRSQEILAMMLTRKSRAIVQKVLEKAMDDEDKDQMECLKIVMDRIIPKDYLVKNTKGNQIQINITGIGQEVSTIDMETIDNDDLEEDDAE
jgi:hypothetical protein